MKINKFCILNCVTRQSTNVHFFKIFSFQNNNRQFSSCGYITKWEANISQLFLLLERKREREKTDRQKKRERERNAKKMDENLIVKLLTKNVKNQNQKKVHNVENLSVFQLKVEKYMNVCFTVDSTESWIEWLQWFGAHFVGRLVKLNKVQVRCTERERKNDSLPKNQTKQSSMNEKS